MGKIANAAIIVPLALLLERRRPKLTWKVTGQACLCDLLGGSMAQNLYAEDFVLTSATLAATLMERLGLGTMIGKAKVASTLMCTGGAMLLMFYKGAELNIWLTNVHLFHKGGHVASLHSHDRNDVVGPLLVVSCCVSTPTGLTVQHCSNDLSNRDWGKWKLGWNLRLLTVSYPGIVACGVTFSLMAWCVQIKGPLFVSVFSPVLLVLVAIAGSLLLDEKLHLGSALGAVVIVCRLYMVLWGKSKELKRIPQLMPSKSSEESEHIDIIVTSSTENNNGSSDNIVAVEEEEEKISSEVEGVSNLDQMSSHEIVAI
ncbi:WAT1-related protein [Camellia lanceoleosa]|uniref:WAT1-related protein n=1 Tax=Camellia lanceoleosa TaxID=1840588 RepID=A0ACC0IUK9_9ERIC|nr:WAT1-related protein [Camellia lanceoleosa]